MPIQITPDYGSCLQATRQTSFVLIFILLQSDDADSAGSVQEARTQQDRVRYAHHLHTKPEQGILSLRINIVYTIWFN